MKFISRNIEEVAYDGFTHRLDFSTADIPAGIAVNTALVVSVASLPILKAGMVAKRVEVHLSTPFKNTADAAFNSTTLSIGDAGSATRFVNAVQINANGTAVIDTFPGTENTIYTADSQISLTLTPSPASKTLSSLNVGKFYVLFAINYFSDPARVVEPTGPGLMTGYV